MAKFVVFAKRIDPLEARLRVFCMTDDREDKTLEHQEHYTEVAKSRDVEVLEDKVQFIELAGNLVPITKSGEHLKLPFKAFLENRLPFAVRVKDQHADTVGRALFMREPKIAKGEAPQQPICILNIVLPENIIPEQLTVLDEEQERALSILMARSSAYASTSPPMHHHQHQMLMSDLRIVDISNLLGEDWIRLAPEIGINQTDIDVIIAQNPASTAKQAQGMLTLFQSRSNNDINILENGLRTIQRDDIVNQCIKSILTTSTSITTKTTTTTKSSRTYSSVKPTSLDSGRDNDEPDLMKDSESIEELVQEDLRHELKYSVEEKVVEKSESESEEVDDVHKTVAERRQQIQKRLSTEKTAPSSQKKEIQEEIVEIKRRSLIEERKSQHEEEILMQKPIDNSYKTTPTLPESVVKLKTSTSKDGSVAVTKEEFDQELQGKFKSTLKDVEQFEHIASTDNAQQIHQVTIEDQEKKEVYDIGSDLLEKVDKSEVQIMTTKVTSKQIHAGTFTSEESTDSTTTTTSNGVESVLTKSTITTITTGEPAFTIRTDTKLDGQPSLESKDSKDEISRKEDFSIDEDFSKSQVTEKSLLDEVDRHVEIGKIDVVPEIKQLDEVILEEQVKVEKKMVEKFDEITKGSQLITPAGKFSVFGTSYEFTNQALLSSLN